MNVIGSIIATIEWVVGEIGVMPMVEIVSEKEIVITGEVAFSNSTKYLAYLAYDSFICILLKIFILNFE